AAAAVAAVAVAVAALLRFPRRWVAVALVARTTTPGVDVAPRRRKAAALRLRPLALARRLALPAAGSPGRSGSPMARRPGQPKKSWPRRRKPALRRKRPLRWVKTAAGPAAREKAAADRRAVARWRRVLCSRPIWLLTSAVGSREPLQTKWAL
ncbi:MAG: hypothetical protein WBL20_16270, partial [Sphingobium sp.]